MSGFVLIRDNPYMAKSQTTGEFEIKNIPAGTHVFRLWHEEAGYLRNVSFDKLQTDDRGRLTIDIKAGDNQLGTAKIPNALFGKTE